MGNPKGVVSLLALLQWFSDYFIESFSSLNRVESVVSDLDDTVMITEEAALAVYAKVGVLAGMSAVHKFNSVADQCRRITETLERKRMCLLPSEMKRLLNDLRQRWGDELKSRVFLCLETNEGHMFEHPEEHWETITGRFYKTRHNVEESAKCFATGRYGAAVFHILLVAEYGVIQLADLVKTGGGHPGWGQLKKLLDSIKNPWPQRDPLVQEHSKLLEDVIPLLYHVKESWRHKITHVDTQIVWEDTDFSPQVADEIIKATRGFMRKLASEMPRGNP